ILIGSDGKPILKGDIAIWTPEGWTADVWDSASEAWVSGDVGLPYSAAHPGTITLHIDMNHTGVFAPVIIILNIVSWNITN
ncbi:MAG: hypothetical protein COZ67_00975, partial [Chloroflexi bacterium CG_4_8_14_3_um_filter_45_15]